jgi:heat shock protein HtpX
MSMVKRVFLFVLVNILVLLTISITLNVLGVRPYLNAYGVDYGALLAFCAVCGFSGALISLGLSRWMAKTMMGVRVIDPSQASGDARELLNLVQRLVQKVGLPSMPEVGIYDSPEVNAFATGPSKSRALVAVSTGLLDSMDWPAVEGVLGHELSHVGNGDMVTMTLLQGVVNTFVMFFARIAAWAVSQAMSGDREREERPSPWIQYIMVYVFEILFSLLGTLVVAWFSRWREFRADRGGARVAGKEKMIHALESLKAHYEGVDTSHPQLAAFKINGGRRMSLFATHPDLDTRIARLKSLVG